MPRKEKAGAKDGPGQGKAQGDTPVRGEGSRTEDLSPAERDTLEKLWTRRENTVHLFNAAPAPLAVTTLAQGRFLAVNDAFLKLTGYSREEILGRLPGDLNLDLDLDRVELRARLKEKGAFEGISLGLTSKNGARRRVLWSGEVLGQGPGALLLSALTDITERHRAQRHQDILAQALEQTGDEVLITEPDGTIIIANSARLASTGYSREEMLGRPVEDVLSAPAGGVLPRFAPATPGEPRVWRGRVKVRRRDGSSYPAEAVVSPVTGEDGEVTHLAWVTHDVTTESFLRSQVLHAQKMEALGTLAGGIAHDFNNIIYAIMGYADLAQDDLEPGGQTWGYLEQIRLAGRRAARLTEQLLTYSRKSEPELKPMEAARAVTEVLDLMRATLPATLELRQHIDTGPAQVLAEPTQIHQIVMNLVNNAAAALGPGGGRVEVGLRRAGLEEDRAGLPPAFRRGPRLRLSVKDNGPGIRPELVDRIFDPFFTTRPPGSGTGLGLSVVLGLVQGMGGEILVDNHPGVGVEFVIYLPELENPVPLAAGSAAPPGLEGGKESILVVDDERLVCAMLESMLTALGYRVTATTRGREALEAFRQNPGAYDLVLTDQTMPGITGLELAREILERRPGMPVILCTGYSDLVTPGQALEMGVREFVRKPVERRQLARLIRQVLENGTAGEEEGGSGRGE